MEPIILIISIMAVLMALIFMIGNYVIDITYRQKDNVFMMFILILLLIILSFFLIKYTAKQNKLCQKNYSTYQY